MTTDRSSINITWYAWDENTDSGDGPVNGYVVKWRKKSDSDWTSINLTRTTNLQHTVPQLKPYTDYVVEVAAYREGPGGLGKPSPIA